MTGNPKSQRRAIVVGGSISGLFAALLLLRHGWHVALAYVVGFAVMLAVTGWHPSPKRGHAPAVALPGTATPAAPAK